MKPEVKQKWVAALRSGDYTQGKGVLHSKSECTHCVLGVLCEISGLGEWVLLACQSRLNEWDYVIPEFVSRGTIVPLPVVDWAGIGGDNELNIGGKSKSIWEHNDAGATFNQLADAIEQQL